MEVKIKRLQSQVSTLEAHAQNTAHILKDADARLKRSVQSISVKHFAPFQNAGGQQSFATALVSEKGDGVVVSGIHSRDGVRVYAKPIERFESKRELSNEEHEAIRDAKKVLDTPS